MKDALTGALAAVPGDGTAVIFVGDVADLPLIRAAAVDHALVLMVLAPTVPILDRNMLLAAVGVLAVDCAPRARIAALDVRPGADVDDVVATALFLATAESTTGQIVPVTPR
ncbi:Rossmann fold domain-containing protein [Sphingomonas sp.]|uniref:Rossmann fold domain-containing protein n=1 Tax=Sphingomonas sp. TaxID=28214 RepID=UPI0033403DE1